MDIYTAFNYFINMFKFMLNNCCHLYTPKIISNTIKNPWINNSLLKCIHHKFFLLKLFIANTIFSIIRNIKNIGIFLLQYLEIPKNYFLKITDKFL